MWIKAIAGVVTELHRSGPMAAFGGWLRDAVAVAGFGLVWHRYAVVASGATATVYRQLQGLQSGCAICYQFH